LNAVKRVKKVKGMLQMIGVDPNRIEFYNLSAAQGPRWAEICTEFTEKIITLGPSPIWFGLQKKKQSGETEKQIA